MLGPASASGVTESGRTAHVASNRSPWASETRRQRSDPNECERPRPHTVTADTSSMIYGREELARTVARHEGSVLLITGDSGIGKTRVLQLARDLTENAVAPLPLTLVRSSGALRSAFLEQLGDALERMVSDGLGTRSLAERLADTGRRLTNERDAVIARVALAELVSLIRGRIGDEVGKAVTAYAKEIWPDTAETLAAKAAQTRDPLIVEILCAFAETTAQLASGARVVLSLDMRAATRRESALAPPARAARASAARQFSPWRAEARRGG
jgi:hypothetical protein